MKTNYNLSFLLEDTGCYNESQIEDLFPKGKEEVNYLDIINSGISLQDKFWFFCKRVFTIKQNQQIAIESAECVLPIYEKKYPDNKAPREAIEAAKLYLVGDISFEELEIKREAVKAAGRATSYAAYAAVDAACAAAGYAACAAAGYAAAVGRAAAVYATSAAGGYRASAATDATSTTTTTTTTTAAVDYSAYAASRAAAVVGNTNYEQKLIDILINFIESN